MDRQLPTASFFLAAAWLLSSCGSNQSPTFEPLKDGQAYVDTDFQLVLRGHDPDGDTLHFSFISDIKDIGSRAQLVSQSAEAAVFQWRPTAKDIGSHPFDFTVSDGKATVRQTINIDVLRSANNQPPVFRQPLGSGTLLDLTQRDCLDVPIVVEDLDSTEVTIAQEGPLPDGASFTQSSSENALWHWCPTADQISLFDDYVLNLSADDGVNPKTIKSYLIVLRKKPNPDCPGTGPSIVHTPGDQSTLAPVEIRAQVTDDVGLQGSPFLYYSLQPPSEPPDLSQMVQLSMQLLQGNSQDGLWNVQVPNPVASGSQGTSQQLYYVIIARDNDDPQGNCDHTEQAPAQGTFSMTVTNPGGQGGLGLCQSCSADSQCGGAQDNCVLVPGSGQTYCSKACSLDTDCGDSAYYCSTDPVQSSNQVLSRQCLPKQNGCGPAYSHTIGIDGVLDFNTEESFGTSSSPAYTGYISWDADFIYFGMAGPDISAGDGRKWLLIYLSGEPGSQSGQVYNTQRPQLPFAAGYHVRWKGDNNYTGAEHWDGGAWVDAHWDFTGAVYRSGNYVEMRIARAWIGAPSRLKVLMSMVNEANLAEYSYAAVPSGAFLDGYNPSYRTYFEFDFSASKAPNQYGPLP